MTPTRFRLMIVAWMGIYLWWFTIPRGAWKEPDNVREALRYHGTGAILHFNRDRAWIVLSLALITAAAMMFWQNWARHLFAAIAVYNILIGPLLGVGVSTPLQNFLGSIYGLLKGVIIACAYFSPIALMFKRPRDVEKQLDGDVVEVFATTDAAQARVAAVLLENDGIAFTTTIDGDTHHIFVRESEGDDARVALASHGVM